MHAISERMFVGLLPSHLLPVQYSLETVVQAVQVVNDAFKAYECI